MNQFRRIFLAAAVFALAVAAPAWAQQATVSGTVTDPLGARVAGATVTLTGEQSTDVKSGGDGTYAFSGVAAGLYQVVVTQDGFQPFSSEPVYVAGDAKRTIDVTLQVSPLQQSVLVTAAATGIAQTQTGAPISVLDASTLETLNKPDVLEALRLVPGAQVVQTGPKGGTTSLYIRGGNSNFNKVLIDGAVANEVGGAFDFSQLSTGSVERVEVLRQTNSVMYGSDALAGVVSIETKRGRTRTPEFTLAADGGNLSTWNADAGIGGMARRLNYYAGYRKYETANDLPNNSYHNGTFAYRVGTSVGSNSDLSVTLRRTDAEYGNNNGFSLYGLADDAKSHTDQTYFSSSFNSQVTNRVQTTLRFGIADSISRYVNPAPTGEYFDPFGFGGNYLGNTVTLTGANGYTVTGRGILDFGSSFPQPFESQSQRHAVSGESTFMVSNAFSISGGARWEREAYRECSDRLDCLSLMSTDERDAARVTRNNGGAFIEGRASLMNRHYVNAGVGVEHNEAFGEAVTPRISVASYLRQPSSTGAGDTKIVLNAGTGIKAPAVYQQQSSLYQLLTDANVSTSVEPIGPERSTSFDIGVEQGLSRNRARARVAWFHNTFHDLIEFINKTQLPAAGLPATEVAKFTGFGAYANNQSYTAQGVEVSFEEQPRTDLRVMASYTYLDAEVTKAFSATAAFNLSSNFSTIPIGAFSPLVGNRPFRRPTNSGTFGVMYTPSRYEVALSAYFSGKRDDSTFMSDAFFDNSMLLPNQDLADSYQKIDLSGAVQVHPRLKVYTSVENLLNQKYEASFGFPALPITARVGFKVRLGGDK